MSWTEPALFWVSGFIVTMLALVGRPDTPCAAESIVREMPLEVRVELPKSTYALGEPITFVVTTNRDCYFLLFTIDPNDKVEIHDPIASGAYMGHPLLTAGERPSFER